MNRTGSAAFGKRAHLLYLYAEPDAWPDGRPIHLRGDRTAPG